MAMIITAMPNAMPKMAILIMGLVLMKPVLLDLSLAKMSRFAINSSVFKVKIIKYKVRIKI